LVATSHQGIRAHASVNRAAAARRPPRGYLDHLGGLSAARSFFSLKPHHPYDEPVDREGRDARRYHGGATLREADLLGANLTNTQYAPEDLEGALHVPLR
jgi:hypothetical protein